MDKAKKKKKKKKKTTEMAYDKRDLLMSFLSFIEHAVFKLEVLVNFVSHSYVSDVLKSFELPIFRLGFWFRFRLV